MSLPSTSMGGRSGVISATYQTPSTRSRRHEYIAGHATPPWFATRTVFTQPGTGFGSTRTETTSTSGPLPSLSTTRHSAQPRRPSKRMPVRSSRKLSTVVPPARIDGVRKPNESSRPS